MAQCSMFLGLFVYFTCIITVCCSVLSGNVCEFYYEPGDVMIGGMLPMYPGGAPCGNSLLVPTVEIAEMWLYAVESINQRDDLLPNVTIGLEIRNDCGNQDIAMWSAMTMVAPTGRDEFLKACPGTTGIPSKSVIGIVGPTRSTTSSVVARIGRLYEVPVISMAATSDELSDSEEYPYFLRTVPSDNFQAGAILDLLEYFNWRYITLLYSADTYGIRGAHHLQLLAEERGICIGVTLPIPGFARESDLVDLTNTLNSSLVADVVVVVSLKEAAESLLTAVSKAKFMKKITWVGSDGWGSSIAGSSVNHVAHGSIFVQLFNEIVPEFHSYFRDNYLNNASHYPWYLEYVDRFRASSNNVDETSYPVPVIALDIVTINSVYVFAHALHAYVEEYCSEQRPCEKLNSLDGEEFLGYLLNVSFEGANGDPFYFDKNGDTAGKYKYRNLQFEDGVYQMVDIGIWDPSSEEDSFVIWEDSIQWGEDNSNPGDSTCHEECSPGYYPVPLSRKCCWGCRKCPDNAIVVNDTECLLCPELEWPNYNFSECIPIIPRTVGYNDPIIIVIIASASLGVFLTSLAIIGLIYHKNHALIKASSRELSACNLFGILLALLTHVPLLMTPTYTSCSFAETMMTTSFTLTYAPTLLKVNRIFRIFQSGKKSVKRPKFVGPKGQLMLLGIAFAIQIVLVCCTASIDPSTPQYLYTSSKKDTVELYCRLGIGFLASIAYNAILIIACCFYAFKARKVPSNYNESKFIAASVYSTVVVCVSLIPVYTTAVGVVQMVSALCAALLLTAYITLISLYLPKLYAIHFVSDDEDLQIQNWRTSNRIGTEISTRPTQNTSSGNNDGGGD
ncbi:metabotropic glutamate receptor-like [Amphiura filiformis]|uniref:metabotropic glutamate receptor-like n=1 Tax=Amphiura filiformis TaxID=82378 RepID=UPI003B21086C